MIKRQNLKKADKVKVTFVLPHDPEEPPISVVGDFNDWSPSATKLVKRNNGTRSASIQLEPNHRYAFRYYAADGQWFNDQMADAYEPSGHGTENCIVLT